MSAQAVSSRSVRCKTKYCAAHSKKTKTTTTNKTPTKAHKMVIGGTSMNEHIQTHTHTHVECVENERTQPTKRPKTKQQTASSRRNCWTKRSPFFVLVRCSILFHKLRAFSLFRLILERVPGTKCMPHPVLAAGFDCMYQNIGFRQLLYTLKKSITGTNCPFDVYFYIFTGVMIFTGQQTLPCVSFGAAKIVSSIVFLDLFYMHYRYSLEY